MIIALCVLVSLVVDLGFAVVVGRAISNRPAAGRPVVLLRMPENRQVREKFTLVHS